MNLTSLDLNLLVALDALLREASVSRAAMRIGLSQPAASHALQRLRELIGDPLLVRSGARMELTPRALALRAPLAQALDQVRALFVPDDFDASRSERQFRLMMPDLAVELLMPPLMEKVTRLAPNVTIDVAGPCDLHGGICPHHRHGDLDRQCI
jgi:DNA-binding transcriptional LysR family regulator